MSRGLRIVFLVHAIVSVISGIVMYIVPGTWASSADWAPFDPAITRIYGAALLALALSSWLGFRATSWEEVRIVVQMEIAFTVLGALGGLYEVLFADAPSSAWASVVIFVAFAIAWFFYYRREAKRGRGQSG